MDIGAGNGYPAANLSNSTYHGTALEVRDENNSTVLKSY